MSFSDALEKKIRDHSARVGVIGLGYVGLPLAVEFAQAGFQVTGIDLNSEKTARINAGDSYVPDVPSAVLGPLAASGKLRASTDFGLIAEFDTIDICVPTPLRKTKDPDMSYIVSSCQEIAKYLHPGMLVILESTTYPGTTDELLLPMFEASGLRAGSDFFLCFSPERVDPGNPTYQTANIPKVVGGITPACTQMGALFYQQAMESVVPVSSTQVAEMVKLLENTFRMINIGMVNEMAMMCDRMGINVWEVIDAAATKPFGFMKFTPGPGLGGHCIPIDPLYLSWKMKAYHFNARFIELASEINANMPRYVVGRILEAMNDSGKVLKGAHCLVLGAAYKPDIDDIRESPALEVIEQLLSKGALVEYHDPYIPKLQTNDNVEMRCVPDLMTAVRAADVVVIVTNHKVYDYKAILAEARFIFDSRNALGKLGVDNPKVVKL